jgi:WD40 repeat protein
MSSLGGKKKSRRPQKLLEKSSQQMLSDYVTGVVWSSDGKTLAASSAAGEVILWQGNNSISILQDPIESSIDCLSFSHDGKYLATGGQNGQVKIWYLPTKELVTTVENAPAWVDQLAWSCSCHQLAFSLGRSVQVWDLDTQAVVTTLNFEASSVFSLAWHPIAAYLAIAGYQGVKVWRGEDWHDDPYLLSIPSASQAIAFRIRRWPCIWDSAERLVQTLSGADDGFSCLAWQPQGQFLAAGGENGELLIWAKSMAGQGFS